MVVYEGFNYPADGVHDAQGEGSFGFSGPWENSRKIKDNYKVNRDALGGDFKGASVSFSHLWQP